MEGMKIIIEKIPHKWKGVQSVHIKSTNSIALPVYATLPEVAFYHKEGAIEGEKMDIETAGKKESKDKVTPTKEKKEKKEVTSPKAQTNEKKESKKNKETVTPTKEKKESKKSKVESAALKTPETKKDSTASKTMTEPRKGTKKRAAIEDEGADDKDTKKKLKKKRKSI